MAEKLTAEELGALRLHASEDMLLEDDVEPLIRLLDEHAALTARVAELEASNAKLEKDSDFLDALSAEGVDNWSGYDDAVRRLDSEED